MVVDVFAARRMQERPINDDERISTNAFFRGHANSGSMDWRSASAGGCQTSDCQQSGG
jgi:hypothetical protein